MAEPTLAQVALAFFEYRAEYREPVFDLAKLQHEVAQSTYAALRPWNVKLEDISWKKDPMNAAEVQVAFKLLAGRGVFSVGLGASTLFVNNPDWQEANLLGKIARTGLDAVLASAGVVLEKQTASISMHLKPKGRTISELTANFVRLEVTEEAANAPRGYGFSVYRENSGFVVDVSAVYADALFVRIYRSFSPAISLENIASEMETEENKILGLLELKVN